MKFHYDLTQADEIVRDLPVTGTSDILQGAAMAYHNDRSDTANQKSGHENAIASTLANVSGVAYEFYDYSAHISNTGSNAATATATGVTNYIKASVNPMAIWLAEYSQSASDLATLTAADSSGKTITDTGIQATREADWAYVVSGTGAGNLFQIGAQSSTTSLTAATSYDDNLAANAIGDTYFLVSAPYGSPTTGGNINLSAQTGNVGTHLIGSIAAGTGAILVINNWIKSLNAPSEVLRVEKHSGRTFDSNTCHIFADVQLLDHLLLGATVANAPVDIA